jgi:hypothetical protein
VPLDLVGSPVIPVDQTLDPSAAPAVSDAYGVVIAGIGALGSGLVYTAPVDRAPDGGATPAWSVCNSEPDAEEPVEPEPTCTKKGQGEAKGQCREDKGKKG